MTFSMIEAKRLVKEHFERAQRNLLKKSFVMDSIKMAEPLSDVVRGYSAKEMEFGDYKKDNFTTLFIDIRRSTDRASRIGPKNTFLTLHAFFPGVAYTIEQYDGFVLDFMGDGVMAFFGGRGSGMAKSYAAKRAGLCGMKLLEVVQQAVNPVLKEAEILWPLQCGVGIAHGSVVVTKIGTNSIHDVKAFGNCINKASKLSSGTDKVIVTKQVKELWPSSKGGKMRFHSTRVKDVEGYELRRNA